MVMSRHLRLRIAAKYALLTCAILLARSAFAVIDPNTWTPTSGSNNFNTAGNWGDGNTPNNDDAALVTNNVASGVTNTAYTSASTSWFGDDLAGLVVSNSNAAGSGINRVLVNTGHHLEMHQLVIGRNGIVELVNNATLSSYRGGTLSSGGTLWLNGGVYRNNGESRGDFFIDGTVISDSGTMDGSPFAANNLTFVIRSGGKVIANTGTFFVNTDDAFSNGGLRVDSGGTLQVNSGATFVLDRSANAWNNGPSVTNNGTVFLNGGTLTFSVDGGGQAATNRMVNNGIIVGSGTLAVSVKQGNADFTIASNGVLNIFGTYNGGQATFTFASTSSDYGTFKAVSGGTLKIVGNVASGMGGAWVVDNGGTLELASGVSADLGSTFMPGSQLNGTIKVNSGANLTLAAATATGPTLLQNGTFEFAPGASAQSVIYMPNASGLAAFTNAGTFILTGAATGSGTFQGGFGSGQNNYGFVNTGTILAGSGGTLVFNSADASAVGGFSNAVSGRIIVSNDTDLVIRRDTTAWNNGSPNVPTTLGNIILNTGTVLAQAGTSADATRMLRNDGTISTWANSTNTLRLSVQNLGTLAVTGTASEVRFAGTGTASVNAGAGVIDVRNQSRLIFTNLASTTSLNFSNAGTIRVQNGTVIGGNITNTGTIVGDGTVTGAGVVNAGTILASNLTANVATLTVQLSSFTNAANATIGVLGTSTVLNVWTPGNAPVLINQGTVTLSGGTITNSQVAGAFTITNFNVIAGVGNLSSLPVVNQAGSSIIAQNPVQGISNLVATVGNTNTSVLGATAVGGAATLNLSVTDGGLVNNGTIALQGGFLDVSNATGTASITNNTGLIYSTTNQAIRVANLAGGRIMASNGVFLLGLESNLNQGVLSNLNSSSTIRLTNSILVNTGSVSLMGGGLVLSGSTITNQGTITGPGDISSALYNDTTGFVAATNGTLNVATNSGEYVLNLGTFNVASGATLNIAPPAWLNTNGTVRMAGGTLSGGTTTNKGTVVGAGTITSTFINEAGGVLKATNANLDIRASTVIQNGTMIGGSAGGATVVITNLSVNLVNSGTMILDSPVGGPTNVAFNILRISGGSGNFTNAATGVIKGAGQLVTGDGQSGGRNFTVHNFGSILATNGALIVNPGDAFGEGGFINQSTGIIDIAAGATFGIQRTENAWLNSGVLPRNSGTILLQGGTLAFYSNNVLQVRFSALSNAVTGVISGFGTIAGAVQNLGTIAATNGTLFVNNTTTTNILQRGTLSIASGATLTLLASSGSFQNQGNFNIYGGTFVATNLTELRNTSTGTITGFGTITGGTVSGSGGANAEFINSGGTIVATNGLLFINPGDAFNLGGFSNSASGNIIIASGAALGINRTANAWDNSLGGGFPAVRNLGTISLQGGTLALYRDGSVAVQHFIENYGTISGAGTFNGGITNFGTVAATNGMLILDTTGRFAQSGTLAMDTGGTLILTNIAGGLGQSFTNGGSIIMRGGELRAGVIANTNVIFGFGTIAGSGIANSGAIYASNGVLVTAVSSYTNVATATLGTLSTNATLDVTMPGGAGQPLINLGTVRLAGGTLLFNGLSSGTISNQGTVTGVGNVTQTVVNNGTVMAANPVSGLNVFSVGLNDLNSATIGASNGAVLNVVLSGGAQTTFNNGGSISMIGGTLIISNGVPGTITNLASAFVTGVGTVMPNIVNLGTVQATVSGGILDVSLSATNSGFLRAGAGATLTIENSSFVNAGTIGAIGTAGGTIQMASASGIITNRGLITGFGSIAINGFVQNDDVGRITATNGIVSFNNINGLRNEGTIDVQNSGTFQSNSSNSWASAGYIDMRGGTLRTGGFTNAAVSAVFSNTGTINGFGTIIGGGAYGGSGAGFDKSIVNLGTIVVTNPLSSLGVTLTISSGAATAFDGIRNLGNMLISSNNTLVLSRQTGLPILNTGTITIQNGTLTGSGVLSNITGGVIQGYGTLTHDIVNLAGGLIHATNGLLTMTSSIFPINEGTFRISDGATMTWNTSNSWRNVGTVDLRGGTLRTGGYTNPPTTAVFTNTVTGLIQGWGTLFGGGAYNTNGIGIDKSFVNEGLVIASNGVLTIDTGVSTTNRGLANLGTMIIRGTNDTLVLRRVAEIGGSVTNLNYLYNSGTILINGGTLTSNTSITNEQQSVSLPGLIQGFGHIALTNELVNFGTIRSTNTVASGDGVLHFINPAGGNVLDIFQSGTLVVEGAGAGGVISEMIFGSATNAVLVNRGTITMNGGYLRSGVLTNINAARITGFGTITSPLLNSGTLLANSVSAALHLTGTTTFNQTNGFFGASSGRLIVDSVFTNAGTVSFLNSVGTFSGQVYNRGAWIMDPSTNVFNATYTVASNGYITTTAGDVMMFKSNFVNQSRLSNTYNTHPGGEFIFNGAGGYTQAFYVAGIDLLGSNLVAIGTPSQTNAFGFLPHTTSTVIGYSNNFAIGALTIGSGTITSTLELIDTFGTIDSNDNRTAGLYVDYFTINPGSLLIISNNVEFYFKYSNGVTGVSFDTLNPGDNVLILGSGSFHQITSIPEPSVLMLLTAGAFVIRWYRRRGSKR